MSSRRWVVCPGCLFMGQPRFWAQPALCTAPCFLDAWPGLSDQNGKPILCHRRPHEMEAQRPLGFRLNRAARMWLSCRASETPGPVSTVQRQRKKFAIFPSYLGEKRKRRQLVLYPGRVGDSQVSQASFRVTVGETGPRCWKPKFSLWLKISLLKAVTRRVWKLRIEMGPPSGSHSAS